MRLSQWHQSAASMKDSLFQAILKLWPCFDYMVHNIAEPPILSLKINRFLTFIGGTSGRQKRERKVPSRYQDTDAFFDSATGMPATSAQKAAAVLMSDSENNQNTQNSQSPQG